MEKYALLFPRLCFKRAYPHGEAPETPHSGFRLRNCAHSPSIWSLSARQLSQLVDRKHHIPRFNRPPKTVRSQILHRQVPRPTT